MAYFTHEQLIPLLLANEAYTLPPALLQHVMEGMLFNDELEELSDKINAQWVSDHLPKLPKRDELQFWIVLGEQAMESFEKSDFQQLPPQKVSGAFNPNLQQLQAALLRLQLLGVDSLQGPTASERGSLCDQLQDHSQPLCAAAQSFAAW